MADSTGNMESILQAGGNQEGMARGQKRLFDGRDQPMSPVSYSNFPFLSWANPEEQQIKLGCVQPSESGATFGDALRRLTDQATHLYVQGKHYWYSTQPSVTRLA